MKFFIALFVLLAVPAFAGARTYTNADLQKKASNPPKTEYSGRENEKAIYYPAKAKTSKVRVYTNADLNKAGR